MLNAARAQGRPMIVIAMMTAATSQPNAIHAPPSTIHRILRSSETGDMVLFSSLAHLYLAGDAIEIEKAGAGMIEIRPCRAGTRLPQAAQAVNCLTIHATSAHGEKR